MTPFFVDQICDKKQHISFKAHIFVTIELFPVVCVVLLFYFVSLQSSDRGQKFAVN